MQNKNYDMIKVKTAEQQPKRKQTETVISFVISCAESQLGSYPEEVKIPEKRKYMQNATIESVECTCTCTWSPRQKTGEIYY